MSKPDGWPFKTVIRDTSELQKMFDQCVRTLMEQGCKSQMDNLARTCVYRDGQGNSCAVGTLIEDAFYNESLEDLSPGAMPILRAIWSSGYGREMPINILVEFLSRLQNVHDMLSVDDWPDGFLQVAKDYNLSSTVLEPYLDE